MTTKKTTTELRRCKGSARFGIEPHDAPISDFPVQPSRPDGLGTMCTEHWKAYVKGLTADRKARVAGLVTNTGETVMLTPAAAKKVGAALDRTTRKATPKRRQPAALDPKVAAAEALIAEVDALPGPEAVKRNGDPDVQAALETVAAANGSGRETPLGEGVDGGSEEADAA